MIGMSSACIAVILLGSPIWFEWQLCGIFTKAHFRPTSEVQAAAGSAPRSDEGEARPTKAISPAEAGLS